MSAAATELKRYLLSIRRRAARIHLGLGAWDVALGVMLGLGLAVLGTYASQRGDLGRLFLAAGALLWGALVGAWHARQWWLGFGSLRQVAQSVAKQVAQTEKKNESRNLDGTPLQRPNASPSSAEVSARFADHEMSESGLRAEILAAWQLHEDALRPAISTDGSTPKTSPTSPTRSPMGAKGGDSSSPYSEQLREHYIAHIAARSANLPPSRAWPGPWLTSRLGISALLLLGALGFTFVPSLIEASEKLWQGVDDRKAPPAKVFWSDLKLRVHAPDYTGQAVALWDNPIGAQSLLKGSMLEIEIAVPRALGLDHLRLRDRSARVPGPESESNAANSIHKTNTTAIDTPTAAEPLIEAHRLDTDNQKGAKAGRSPQLQYFSARIEVTQNTQLEAIAWPEGLPPRLGAHAPLLTLKLLPDERPTVQLQPPAAQKSKSEREQSVVLVVQAQDDYGLNELEVVYQLPDGEKHHLPLPLEPNTKKSHQRYVWDLSTIPLEQRAEVIYWAQARDNDPSSPAGSTITNKNDAAKSGDDAEHTDSSGTPNSTDNKAKIGKIGESEKYMLEVEDHQAKHSRNIADLMELRAQALDLLALRLVPPPRKSKKITGFAAGLHARVDAARALHTSMDRWLATLSMSIDHLSVDALAGRASIRVLSEIHTRMQSLQHDEREFLQVIPPRWLSKDSAAARALTRLRPKERADGSNPNAKAIPNKLVHAVLDELSGLNPKFIAQLEDEIIRLDDLVDEQVLEQIEQLLARIQAAQTKLVELLEQLKAGDESVRPKIDQLQRRLALDSRRLQQAREQLAKELGHEFVNQDAFAALQARLQHQGLQQRLAKGDIEGALEQARENLKSSENLRDSVAQRMQNAPQTQDRMSPEAKRRMELLRRLSQMQDDQRGIRAETQPWLSKWQEWSQQERPANPKTYQDMRAAIEALREGLSKIKDASMGREARSRYEELRTQIEDFDTRFPPLGEDDSPQGSNTDTHEADSPRTEASGNDKSKHIPEDNAASDPKSGGAGDEEVEQQRSFDPLLAYEQLEKIQRELAKTKAGAQGRNQKRLARLQKELQKRAETARKQLPSLQSARSQQLFLESEAILRALGERQAGIEKRADELPKLEIAKALSDKGHTHLKQAQKALRRGEQALQQEQLLRAEYAQKEAIDTIQKVIDSLRQPPPPPPPAGSNPPSSTDAEQDKSLRQEVLDAMKERGQEALPPSTKSYYEELLQ